MARKLYVTLRYFEDKLTDVFYKHVVFVCNHYFYLVSELLNFFAKFRLVWKQLHSD